ncbi:MAG: hypothetical protein QOJ81_1602 [Chloroflexota bacterium]|jgi:hypothetical protein|nr:hypothetical protein [Chloroflexota bacterium]
MNFTMPWTASNGHANGTTDKLEDVRNALGREVDHLAHVAAQMGRDAGAQADGVAHDVARDAQKQTNVAINRIADIAATLGPTIAAVGRQRMRQVGDQAQTLGNELRQVRITTEPRRNEALPGIAIVGGLGIGLGLGIAAMYLFDPEHGMLRRQVLGARLARMTRDSRAVAAEKANAIANRTVGVVSEVRESVTSGIGGPEEPLIAEELSYETWPEGTRVPTA